MADDYDVKTEVNFALALAPIISKMLEEVTAQLPVGTEIGLFILPAHIQGNPLDRVLVATTDRQRMVRPVGEWVMATLSGQVLELTMRDKKD